jgi:trk system potassium uptake protein TrkA
LATRLQVAVFGLGRFGAAVARELTHLGHDVLAVDLDPRTVQSIADDVTHAAQADATDLEALQQLGIGSFDAAVVGVSESLEVSVLTCVLLKQLGVPHIVAKAASELHGHVLRQLGVTQIVYPEVETASRVAHSFAARSVADYFAVAPGYGLARVPVANSSLVGQDLGRLNLPRTCNVSVLALTRQGVVTLHPGDHEVLRPGDELIVGGYDGDLERIPGHTLR